MKPTFVFSSPIQGRSSLFNRDVKHGCLVCMFSLRLSGIKFLINSLWQFRVRKIYRTQVFAGFPVFSFCV